jgi:Co/Zn/Cd efflux system component
MHGHVHAPASTSRLLRIALLLTLGYIALTVFAGIKAHSLALLSEAGHNVSDFLALLLSWVAVYLGSRPPTLTKTYGYHRAFIHMLGDTLSTASVIIGGWAILWTGKYWIDPALSFAIGALILWSSFGIVRETLNILLEGTPKGVSMDLLADAMKQVSGVRDVHDLHVWSIGSEMHALSCHIAIADIPPSESEAILRDVRLRLEQFHIHHTTIQFEHENCEIAHGCVMPIGVGTHHHER